MKKIYKILLAIIFIIGILTEVQGQNIILKQSHPGGIYKDGDRIVITMILKDHGRDSVAVKIRKNYNPDVSRRMVKYMGTPIVIFDEKFTHPSSGIIEASTTSESASTGFVVAPEKFKSGTACPPDFDQFWDSERKMLHDLPLEAKTISKKVSVNGYSCVDLELNCTGPKPARGYFAKPESASLKSLPIVLSVHAAGVKGSWCRSEPELALYYAQMGKGALCFDLNAHGMLNGQPEEYYIGLEKGELKDYYFQGMENRNDFYFRGMYLRLMRAIDFLTSQPEWDGKRILVIGESQGGGQALAAAGLDQRVGAVVATVPAMCDWGGGIAGFKGGWPQPLDHKGDMEKQLATLPYFDNAHLLKRSRATILVEIGLIDNTCPSTSIYAAVNQAKGKKTILAVPYRPHYAPSGDLLKNWETGIYKQKEKFIKNYLK